MYKPQRFVDLDDNAAGIGAEANSWLAGGLNHSDSSPILRRTQDSLAEGGAVSMNLDRNLLNDLVDIVPLVQSLIDKQAKSSFTRRGWMIYTKKPARELYSKASELKGKHASQSIPTKKLRDLGDEDQSKHAGDNKYGCANNSFHPANASSTEHREELIALRDQVEDLQRKLSEKDEHLISTEIVKDQMASAADELNELKQQLSEKDSVVKTTQQQLSDAKIMLADRQAAVEKLRWEAMNSNTQAEKLQEDVNIMQAEMSSILILCEGLRKNNDDISTEDYEASRNNSDQIMEIDCSDELDMQRTEAAQEAYIAAVAAAKEIQDDESIAAARSARGEEGKKDGDIQSLKYPRQLKLTYLRRLGLNSVI